MWYSRYKEEKVLTNIFISNIISSIKGCRLINKPYRWRGGCVMYFEIIDKISNSNCSKEELKQMKEELEKKLFEQKEKK